MECIEKILRDIHIGRFFSGHYVIDQLTSGYSDEYLGIAQRINSKVNLTLRTHQRIGNEVAKFEGRLVERQPGESWSVNIHGKASSCALWKRI